MLYGYMIDNMFPIFVTYVIGDTLSVAFLAVYLRCTTKRRAAMKTCAYVLLLNAAVTVYAILAETSLLPHSHDTAVLVMGIIGTGGSFALYASPLAAIKFVLQTRSSESQPFALILSGMINNMLWVVYGAIVSDLFVIFPSGVSAAIGFIQVVLCGVFRPSVAGSTMTSVVPCESPKDELPMCSSYTEMESVSPSPMPASASDAEGSS